MKPKENLALSLLLAALIISASNTGFNPVFLVNGLPSLAVLMQDMFPPDPRLLNTAFWAMLETLQIALLGTFIGALLAVPMGLFASRNLFTKYLYAPARILLASIRTIPSLLWAVFFVIIVGLGPFAGVLATAMYSLGYLSKLHYEAIEAIDPEPYQAVDAIGASKLQLIRFVVIPQAAPYLLSQLVFMFEYNVRASTILGFVGAGGIGFYVQSYLRLTEYDAVLTFLLVVLAAVLVIDWGSVKLRDRYIVPVIKTSS